MKRNISLNGEDVILKKSVPYYAIDALYLDSIAFEIHNLNLNELESELRTKVFPYNDLPFAKITPLDESFAVGNILKNTAVPDQSSLTAFSSDTGLIMLLNSNGLVSFVETFNYAKLVESQTDLINFEYWDSIVGKFDYDDCALIYTSTGGGIYRIK